MTTTSTTDDDGAGTTGAGTTGAGTATDARTRPARWRPVDIVVASVLGVAGGLLLTVWNVAYGPVSAALAVYPPLSALVAGVWLLPGVLGALVVRRPGAAVFVELVAAVLSALVGNQWGFVTVWYGLAQGLAAEAVFAALRYRRWSLPVVLAAGAVTGLVSGLLDTVTSNAELSLVHQVLYVVLLVVSGTVVAGLGSWLLTRGLRATGALAPLASGRGGERV